MLFSVAAAHIALLSIVNSSSTLLVAGSNYLRFCINCDRGISYSLSFPLSLLLLLLKKTIWIKERHLGSHL